MTRRSSMKRCASPAWKGCPSAETSSPGAYPRACVTSRRMTSRIVASVLRRLGIAEQAPAPAEPPIPAPSTGAGWKRLLLSLSPQAGCRGCSPRRGCRGLSPCTQKRWRVGQVGQRRRPPRTLSIPPLHNSNNCAIVPSGSRQPVHSSSSKPAVYILDRGLTTENPPAAGALRGTSPAAAMTATKPALWQGARGDVPPAPQPSGEGWDRSDCRCEASSLEPLRLHYGSLRLHYKSITASLRLVTSYYAYITAPCLKPPKSADTRYTYQQRKMCKQSCRT